MNLRYWGKTLIKLLNLANSVYNFNKMAVKLKNVASKLLTEEAKHVGRWSRGHASRMRQVAQIILAGEQVSPQATLTR